MKSKVVVPIVVACLLIGFQYLDYALYEYSTEIIIPNCTINLTVVWNIITLLAVGIALGRPTWFKRGLTAPKLRISMPNLIITIILLCFVLYWYIWGYGRWLIWSTRFGAGLVWLFVGYFLARTIVKEESNSPDEKANAIDEE